MRRGDLVWLVCFAAAALNLTMPESASPLMRLSAEHRYLTGFLNFAVMGVLADAIQDRLSGQGYPDYRSMAFSAVQWGLHGLVMALAFWLVNIGVVMTQSIGMLPGGGYGAASSPIKATLTSFFITGPFFTSLFLNLSFVPVLLAAQRLARSFFKIYRRPKRQPFSLTRASELADWTDFIRSELPSSFLFRLPLLTLVFMLSSDTWLPLAAIGLVAVAALTGLTRKNPSESGERLPEQAD